MPGLQPHAHHQAADDALSAIEAQELTSSERPSLKGCRAKLERARFFLDELRAREETFQGQGWPFELRPAETILEQGEGWHKEWLIYRCHVTRPIPDDLSLIAGDAAHNMRSALDHLAYQLVLLNNKTPSKRTAFPIFDTRPTSKGARQRFQAAIKLMRRDHQDAIKKLQPYLDKNDPGRLLLSAVNKLDITDKHRLLPPLLSFMHAETDEASIRFTHPVEFEWSDGPLEEGREILRTWQAYGHGLWQLNVPLAFTIRYGLLQIGRESLDDAVLEIVGIVESFANEFSN